MQASLYCLSYAGAALRTQAIFSPSAVLESYVFRLKKEVWFEETVTKQQGLKASGVSAFCHSKLSDLRQAPLCLGSRPGRLSFEGMFPGKREKPAKRAKQIIDYLDFFSPRSLYSVSNSHTQNPGRKQPPTAKIQVREWNDEPPGEKNTACGIWGYTWNKIEPWPSCVRDTALI